MIKLLRHFVDQIVVRLVPQVAGLITIAIDSVSSLIVAEQQAELEDAARKYESQGLMDVATNLRKRLAELNGRSSTAIGDKMVADIANADETSSNREDVPRRLPARRGLSTRVSKTRRVESEPQSNVEPDDTLPTF
jgi:hypothetical protein